MEENQGREVDEDMDILLDERMKEGKWGRKVGEFTRKSGRQIFLEGEWERNENERRGKETADRQIDERTKKRKHSSRERYFVLY